MFIHGIPLISARLPLVDSIKIKIKVMICKIKYFGYLTNTVMATDLTVKGPPFARQYKKAAVSLLFPLLPPAC